MIAKSILVVAAEVEIPNVTLNLDDYFHIYLFR